MDLLDNIGIKYRKAFKDYLEAFPPEGAGRWSVNEEANRAGRARFLEAYGDYLRVTGMAFLCSRALRYGGDRFEELIQQWNDAVLVDMGWKLTAREVEWKNLFYIEDRGNAGQTDRYRNSDDGRNTAFFPIEDTSTEARSYGDSDGSDDFDWSSYWGADGGSDGGSWGTDSGSWGSSDSGSDGGDGGGD